MSGPVNINNFLAKPAAFLGRIPIEILEEFQWRLLSQNSDHSWRISNSSSQGILERFLEQMALAIALEYLKTDS